MNTLPQFFAKRFALASLVATALLLSGCQLLGDTFDADKATKEAINQSFRDQGIATVARLKQDLANEACSAAQDKDPPKAVVERIEKENLATVKAPAGGVYLGDWKAGETLAQSGRGMTWSDAAGSPNGGNCYNCHQISKTEISFGSIGPSLYNYGKLRGVKDPASADSKAIVDYTWGKLYNAKAYNACSSMPRFGHMGILTEKQLQDLMALLLDPKSPVNE